MIFPNRKQQEETKARNQLLVDNLLKKLSEMQNEKSLHDKEEEAPKKLIEEKTVAAKLEGKANVWFCFYCSDIFAKTC